MSNLLKLFSFPPWDSTDHYYYSNYYACNCSCSQYYCLWCNSIITNIKKCLILPCSFSNNLSSPVDLSCIFWVSSINKSTLIFVYYRIIDFICLIALTIILIICIIGLIACIVGLIAWAITLIASVISLIGWAISLIASIIGIIAWVILNLRWVSWWRLICCSICWRWLVCNIILRNLSIIRNRHIYTIIVIKLTSITQIVKKLRSNYNLTSRIRCRIKRTCWLIINQKIINWWDIKSCTEKNTINIGIWISRILNLKILILSMQLDNKK